jgi:hypothetical protein
MIAGAGPSAMCSAGRFLTRREAEGALRKERLATWKRACSILSLHSLLIKHANMTIAVDIL